jgi:hypothetical protein
MSTSANTLSITLQNATFNKKGFLVIPSDIGKLGVTASVTKRDLDEDDDTIRPGGLTNDKETAIVTEFRRLITESADRSTITRSDLNDLGEMVGILFTADIEKETQFKWHFEGFKVVGLGEESRSGTGKISQGATADSQHAQGLSHTRYLSGRPDPFHEVTMKKTFVEGLKKLRQQLGL